MIDKYTIEEIEEAFDRQFNLVDHSEMKASLINQLQRPRHQFREGEVVWSEDHGEYIILDTDPATHGRYINNCRKLRLSEMPAEVKKLLSDIDAEIDHLRAAGIKKPADRLTRYRAAFNEVIS